MGASSSGGGGGGGDNKTYSSSREIGLMNQYKKPKQRAIDTQKMKNDAFREQGAYNTRRSIEKIPGIIPGAGIIKSLSEPLQRNSKRNRDFFTNKVLTDPRGLKNFGYTKEQFEKLSMAKQNKIYGNYITTRRDNKTDGFGTVINEGSDNNNQTPPVATIMPVPSDPNAPATPLDPQPSETEKKYDARRTKKKGRNQNLLTSARGVTKTSADYSLGKKSLLGQVV